MPASIIQKLKGKRSCDGGNGQYAPWPARSSSLEIPVSLLIASKNKFRSAKTKNILVAAMSQINDDSGSAQVF
jgi:hypothetical protein